MLELLEIGKSKKVLKVERSAKSAIQCWKFLQWSMPNKSNVGYICYLPILKKISAWVMHNKI